MPYKDPQAPEAKASKQRCKARWNARHPEQRVRIYRNQNLKKAFGITLEEYDWLFATQKGLCAICQKPEKHSARKGGRPLNLAVDHDHATGKNRALLCMDCNKGIGCFGEDILRLSAAIEYLKRHSGGNGWPA